MFRNKGGDWAGNAAGTKKRGIITRGGLTSTRCVFDINFVVKGDSKKRRNDGVARPGQDREKKGVSGPKYPSGDRGHQGRRVNQTLSLDICDTGLKERKPWPWRRQVRRILRGEGER